MADEITVQLSVQVKNLEFENTFAPGSTKMSQAAQGFHGPVVTVGTTEEVMPTGDISTLGLLVMKNLDAANFVTVGVSTGGPMYPFERVEAGDSSVMRLEPGVIIRWKADTGAVKMQLMLHED